MPVRIERVNGKVRVSTPSGVKSKRTTLQKALKQKRLLNAIEHGYKPGKNMSTMSNDMQKRSVNSMSMGM